MPGESEANLQKKMNLMKLLENGEIKAKKDTPFR
jgi:hypothetical protein